MNAAVQHRLGQPEYFGHKRDEHSKKTTSEPNIKLTYFLLLRNPSIGPSLNPTMFQCACNVNINGGAFTVVNEHNGMTGALNEFCSKPMLSYSHL